MAPVPRAGPSSSSSGLEVFDGAAELELEVPVSVTTTVATSPSDSVVMKVDAGGGGGGGVVGDGVGSVGADSVVDEVVLVDVSEVVESEVVDVVDVEVVLDVVEDVVEEVVDVVEVDVVEVSVCRGTCLAATTTWESASARRHVARRRILAMRTSRERGDDGNALDASKLPRSSDGPPAVFTAILPSI